MNPHFSCFVTKAALAFGLLYGSATIAQDQPAKQKTPPLNWSAAPERILKPSNAPKDWQRFTDSECKAAWYAPSEPKKFINKGKRYSVTYESREDSMVFQLTVVKTEHNPLETRAAFFDAMEGGFLGALERAKMEFTPMAIARLRYKHMTGRKLLVKTDRNNMSVVCLATDSASFSFVVGGPEDQVELAINRFVTSLETDIEPQSGKKSSSE